MNSRLRNCGCRGFTLIELMVAVAVASIIMLGLAGVIGQALHSNSVVHAKNKLNRDAHFAMAQMSTAVQETRHLLLPLSDNPNTDWPENIREQTVPPSAPIGSSTLATAVLAVTLPETIDLDADGIADADNDDDGLIDEDLNTDMNDDSAPGLYLIDDNGNGQVDDSTNASPNEDNDEDGLTGEEILNGLDDDGDGSIDEDLSSDMTRDFASGVIGVDDDDDGSIDEFNKNDDDEDGKSDEDGYESLVFYLQGQVLKKRTPVPWDEDSSGVIDGRDFIVSDIADKVTRFRVERVPVLVGAADLVVITLELTDADSAQSVSLKTRLRVGGAL